MSKKINITVSITDEQKKDIIEIANKQDKTEQEVIEVAIKKYIRDYELYNKTDFDKPVSKEFEEMSKKRIQKHIKIIKSLANK